MFHVQVSGGAQIRVESLPRKRGSTHSIPVARPEREQNVHDLDNRWVGNFYSFARMSNCFLRNFFASKPKPSHCTERE